jgi:hypothetical protein
MPKKSASKTRPAPAPPAQSLGSQIDEYIRFWAAVRAEQAAKNLTAPGDPTNQ